MEGGAFDIDGIVARMSPAAPVVLRVITVDSRGSARIALGAEPVEVVSARSTVPLDPTDAGRHALVLFEGNSMHKPIITGLLQDDAHPTCTPSQERRRHAEVVVDGERIVIEATKDLELRCGEGSIVLKRDGTVIIKGTHVVSRSKGVNKVKGAAVMIN